MLGPGLEGKREKGTLTGMGGAAEACVGVRRQSHSGKPGDRDASGLFDRDRNQARAAAPRTRTSEEDR